jgi:hypothetical protein
LPNIILLVEQHHGPPNSSFLICLLFFWHDFVCTEQTADAGFTRRPRTGDQCRGGCRLVVSTAVCQKARFQLVENLTQSPAVWDPGRCAVSHPWNSKTLDSGTDSNRWVGMRSSSKFHRSDQILFVQSASTGAPRLRKVRLLDTTSAS